MELTTKEMEERMEETVEERMGKETREFFDTQARGYKKFKARQRYYNTCEAIDFSINIMSIIGICISLLQKDFMAAFALFLVKMFI